MKEEKLNHDDCPQGRPRQRPVGDRRPINAERFRIYVEKVLVPELNPEDIIVIDNLGSHKAKAIRAAIRKAAHRMFSFWLQLKSGAESPPVQPVFRNE